MIVTFLFLSIILIIATGVPVGIGLGIVGISYSIIFEGQNALISLPQTIYASNSSFLLTAIPMFILMSEILRTANVTEILFDAVTKWIGHIPGGLAVSTVITCAIGASITGSSVANAASMSIVAAPSMINRGYNRSFTYGLIAASGTLGILIPPSIPMLLYASITEESIGKLFISGIIPGLLLVTLLCLYVVFKEKFIDKTRRKTVKATYVDRLKSTKKALPALILPIIVVGGIYGGFFTPTEAAGVGVFFSFMIGFFWYKTLKLSNIIDIFKNSLNSTCMILLLIAGSMVLGHAITTLQISDQLVGLISSYDVSQFTFVIMIMVLLFILGCILEVISVIYIVLPVLFPIVESLGINSIWFAIIFIVNMEIALITPPLGMNLYVIGGIVKRPISEIMTGALPFVLIFLFFLFILILFPIISTILVL
ncbi:MAG: TRAP transporter large permease subunit [alpha proteobacterium HIMB114]|nr:MAG: TRAP transporter large permease subunit [alpha proteobacterium HIMB114]|tara:strand:+ start:8113 stop:9390 length:1278 start_codon:yes stop_codon:yes gene_type:complete